MNEERDVPGWIYPLVFFLALVFLYVALINS